MASVPLMRNPTMGVSAVREAASTIPIEFPEVDRVHLEDLPNLQSFYSDDLVEWPSLENVTVNKCPRLTKFGLGKIERTQLKSVILENQEQVHSDAKISYLFDVSDEFSDIVEYNIDGIEKLNKTLSIKLKPSHFTKLQQFRAEGCDEMLNKFLSILLKRATLLQHLTIEKCETLKHVLDLNEVAPDKKGEGKYFKSLEKLTLMELPQLSCIWNKDPTGILGLSNLQIMHIKSCHSLQNLITSSVAEKLQQLKEVKIDTCEMLEQVVGMETPRQVTLSGVTHRKVMFTLEQQKKKKIRLPLLSNVELLSLSSLIRFHSENCSLEFPVLKKLLIEKCPHMKAFATGLASAEELSTTGVESFNDLKELKLDCCGNLVYVIYFNTDLESWSLEKLTVSNCCSLKTLFRAERELNRSVTVQLLRELTLTDLPSLIPLTNKSTVVFEKLQILQVKKCKSLSSLGQFCYVLDKMVISDCEALEEIVFWDEKPASKVSQLKNVALENLSKLSTFIPRTSSLSSLETLEIENCPALKTFAQESREMKDPAPPATTSKCFFPNWLTLQNLKVLRVINQAGVEKLWDKSYPNYELLCELIELTLRDNNGLSSVIPFSMLTKCRKLKNMTLEKCKSLMEVFNLEEDKPNRIPAEMLPQLKVLVLSNLSGLMNIWNKEPQPQVPFFRNLESLQIIDCGSLKSVFSVSAAKNLKQLKLLKLYSCQKMNEVISGDEDGKGSTPEIEIIFPEVERLILKDLPNWESFCQQKNTFTWPKLQIVRVSNIPRMKKFSEGHQITPLLKTVFVTFVEKCWQGNLNKTISNLHENAEPRRKGLEELTS